MVTRRTPTDAETEDASVESLPRRNFFTLVGLGSITSATAGSGPLFVQYASPNVLFEPALSFDAGRPEEYEMGIDERWARKQKIWIVRTEKGIYALVAICTHLGCTPTWGAQEQGVHCPCHGSTFSLDGDVREGPAPTPLYRAPIRLDEQGHLIVGTGLLGYGRAEQENEEPARSGPNYLLKV